jgi:site-specific DNA recombinase
MASYRDITKGATTATIQGLAASTPARNTLQVSGLFRLTRAALYARVSTEKQEREETVASQIDLLRQTAAARGYEILPGNVFIDDGVSGTRLDRPALERLRDLAAEGAFDVVLVTAPDRLARRYAYQVVLVEELTRCGCEVVFVHQSLGASPEEQMLLQMQGVFAEYERALIHERTRRGQLFAARQGRVNWGNPPYGYTYVHKTTTTPQHLIVNETEAEVVRQIYRWCVEEQLSSYAIHRRLTLQGVPPRKSKHGRWAQSSVIEILRDSLYKGDAYYNRTQPGDVRRPYGRRGLKDRQLGHGQGRARRPQSAWIPVRVPALIDPETWDRAQGQLARNRARAAPQHAASVSVAESTGLWALWPTHGGHVECPGRPLYWRPALPPVCAGRMHGSQPQGDADRGTGLGARESITV